VSTELQQQPASHSLSFLYPMGAVCMLAFLMLLSAYGFRDSFLSNEVTGATADGAKEAIGMLKDWTTWMAGIQTATIAALGLLAKDGVRSLKLSKLQQFLVMVAALFNTVALLFSGWLLTSTSSLMLRVYANTAGQYDFYNYPLYAYMPNDTPFTVAFFAFWNHWLWGLGVVAFGALALSMRSVE
jgi:hypothetical protein